MITISGTLTNPSGAPLPFVSIFVKAVQSVPGTAAIPESSLATYQTSSTGTYSFTLEEGVYAISISGSGLAQSVSLGQAVVNSSSVDTDLITLVGASGVPTSTIMSAIVTASQDAATAVAVGTTTTGAPGTDAAVSNSGTDTAVVLNFTIPEGEPGADGSPGADGAAATISVGTVTTGAAGSSASVSNAGTTSAAVLDFTIPQGVQGETGPSGLNSSVADGTYTLASLTVNGNVITAVTSGSITSREVTAALGYTPVNNADSYTWSQTQTFSAAITVQDATADANPMTYGQGVVFLTSGSLSPAFNFVQCTAVQAVNSNTLNGTTAGKIIYNMPMQGSSKKLVIVVDNYENDTTTAQSITYPVAFTYQPAITFNNSGLTLTATTTGLTITAPDATTVYNGVIIVEGI